MSLVTLKEIAEAARTDTGTVSRVLSGRYRKARISETRAREIRAIAEKLKWRPNLAARSTRTGRFDSIAIVSSTILEFGHYLSPWFLNWVHDEAHRRNHQVNFVRLSPEQVEGTERAKILEEISVDGWLLNFNITIPASLTRQLESLRIPAVLINNQALFDAVRPADMEGGRRITEALIAAGCQRIVFYDNENRIESLTSPEAHYSIAHRQRGYEQAMAVAGLQTHIVRPPTRVPRPEAFAFALANREIIMSADALLTYNPYEAQVLLMAAERLGRRVPEDLHIGTFHDSPLGNTGLPIATAVIPWRDVAREAVEMLMQKIEQPSEPLPSKEIPYDIHFPSAVPSATLRSPGGQS